MTLAVWIVSTTKRGMGASHVLKVVDRPIVSLSNLTWTCRVSWHVSLTFGNVWKLHVFQDIWHELVEFPGTCFFDFWKNVEATCFSRHATKLGLCLQYICHVTSQHVIFFQEHKKFARPHRKCLTSISQNFQLHHHVNYENQITDRRYEMFTGLFG